MADEFKPGVDPFSGLPFADPFAPQAGAAQQPPFPVTPGAGAFQLAPPSSSMIRLIEEDMHKQVGTELQAYKDLISKFIEFKKEIAANPEYQKHMKDGKFPVAALSPKDMERFEELSRGEQVTSEHLRSAYKAKLYKKDPKDSGDDLYISSTIHEMGRKADNSGFELDFSPPQTMAAITNPLEIFKTKLSEETRKKFEDDLNAMPPDLRQQFESTLTLQLLTVPAEKQQEFLESFEKKYKDMSPEDLIKRRQELQQEWDKQKEPVAPPGKRDFQLADAPENVQKAVTAFLQQKDMPLTSDHQPAVNTVASMQNAKISIG